ncbi:MAG: dihydrolipoyl dehydrogenase [Magnetovibrio sp.]|nr:dihydrolipoyl dehydrogenase [Magnetovibrio sp.]
MNEPYDLIVIGGGPGGYVAAIRAAQLGMKTAIIEKRGALGGTCLNVGCIPSKTLLQSSHFYEMASREFLEHGIDIAGLSLDLNKMMSRKQKVIDELRVGIEFLMKKNKVTYFVGVGKVQAKGKVLVEQKGKKKSEVLAADNILIATGSEVIPLKNVELDEKLVLSSTGALELSKVPETMVVIGAGVIGLELGSVWRRLGSRVTVVEFLTSVLPGMDLEISKQMKRILEKQGIHFELDTKVLDIQKKKSGVTLIVQKKSSEKEEKIKADVVLVSIGRRPHTLELGLENVGVGINKQGFISVDEDFQTSVEGIFAIGDVIGGAMLAHKAEEEAVACVEVIAGQAGHVNYSYVPAIVYTWPEVAAVGKTEEQLKSDGIDFTVGKFPFLANSRAKCNGDTEGFVKFLCDSKTDRILGCHIIGPAAGDLIQEVINVMEFGGASEDLARICHGHPGLPEAVKEAALAVSGGAIHS